MKPIHLRLAGITVLALAALAVLALVGCSSTQGPAGPKGDTGAQGVAGAQGSQGPAGATGAAGPQGPQGPQGSKGDTGTQGPAGAAGVQGAAGAQGAAGTSSGTLSGTVTNKTTGKGVAGVEVAIDPAVKGVSISTDAAGAFTAQVPIGVYTLTYKKTGFGSATATASIVAGQATAKDVALVPASAVVVNAGADQASQPGATVTLKAAVDSFDGSTASAYKWEQSGGVAATLKNNTTDTLTVTLAGGADFKAKLVEALKLQDRFQVLGINPHALEEAEAATFKVTVTTATGTYSDTVVVRADLPYVVTLGISNVPTAVPVLVGGKKQASYSWKLTGPTGSKSALDSATVQYPAFTPDVVGKYTLTESTSNRSVDVYAGTWAGAISGKDAKGLPLSDQCTACHNGTIASDNFTGWKASGHAEIFAVNVNTRANYGESCFACHTVGFNTTASNGGIDDASDYKAFVDSKLTAKTSAQNWETVLSKYPNTAKLANIQCENCHGPNNASGLHMNKAVDAARVSVASEVCGSCHGEPPRHGRYQQWEESKHGDYTIAISSGTSTSCARCHTTQGFLAWLPRLNSGNSGSLPADSITWTAETAEPVTCVACHDPHAQGTTSSEPNTATVRVTGSTALLPSGFKAEGVGRGAMCITCHNTRNGARNDVALPVADDRAPHVAAQGDVLMGENAYFVVTGDRSPHSFITDTCTNCHMELTPPPAEFSYNQSATNHEFSASTTICTQCHGTYNGGSIKEAIHEKLVDLEKTIEAALLAEIKAQIAAGNTVVLKGLGAGGANVNITDASKITALTLEESHGRIAMNITVSGTAYDARIASDTDVKNAAGTSVGTLVTSAKGQLIAKAAWNYFLIHGDGSHGIHNPDFTVKVLNAAKAALK
jgi:hypothetical protein